MSVIALEKFQSRRVLYAEQPRFQMAYAVIGTIDEVLARNAVLAVSPTGYDLYGNGTVVLQRTEIEIEPNDFHYCDAVVSYDLINVPANPFPFTEFDTTINTAHITKSLKTRRYPKDGDIPPNGFTVPDHKGSIGVTGDGEVQGVDIIVPGTEWSETHIKSNFDMSPSYLQILESMVGTVNNNVFRGYDIESVLYRGASGRQNTAEGTWEVSYRFMHSPNVRDIVVEGFTVEEKKGHEYLWVSYESKEDVNSGRLVKRVVGIYVEQVYKSDWFSALGIGA